MPGEPRQVCGVTPVDDLAPRLRGPRFDSLPGFLAVRDDLFTRQPLESLPRPGVDAVMALSCTAAPWNSLCVFTDPDGTVTRLDPFPTPERAGTNLRLAGACWFSRKPPSTGSLEDDVRHCLDRGGVIRAVLPPGRAFLVCSREEQLRACHAVLSGLVVPGVAGCEPLDGMFIQGDVAPSAALSGTVWTAPGSVVEDCCRLENCVILPGAVVGRGSRLRNALVDPGVRVPPDTDLEDKYPSFPGEH
jgi:hypothetical protein